MFLNFLVIIKTVAEIVSVPNRMFQFYYKIGIGIPMSTYMTFYTVLKQF